MSVKRLRRVALVVGAGLLAGAVGTELAKPKGERTWHGRVVGVPYDLRTPTVERLRDTFWAPDDPRIVMPKFYGVGWDFNVGRLVALARQQGEPNPG